jgi:rhodanese-related sulfurtransferase
MLYSNLIKCFFVSTVIVSFLIPSYAAEKPQSIKKQTVAGNYLTALEAHKIKKEQGDAVLFVDIRTPSELVFVGTPKNLDINIPFLTLDYKHWDDKKGSFKKVLNKQFLSGFNAVIKSKNLSKNSTVVLMCRSGKRSAKAANLLTSMGYSNIHTVIDGFEGDKAKVGNAKGKRAINGWKNAGLPWTYKLDRKRFQLEN